MARSSIGHSPRIHVGDQCGILNGHPASSAVLMAPDCSVLATAREAAAFATVGRHSKIIKEQALGNSRTRPAH